jgi:sporulation protein YlmC with PRC-barrel domain
MDTSLLIDRARRWMPALALGMALAAGGAHAQGAAPARASQLIGKLVHDAAGKEIGELRDLVVDTGDGRVAYAVLSIGGYLRLGREHLVAYPLPASEVRVAGERLVVGADRARLQELPGFDAGSWPDFDAGQAGAGGPRLRRATGMIDADLMDRAGKDVGDVKDLLVAIEEGQLRAIVVEFDPSWYEKPGWVALPPQSIAHKGGELVANFEPDDMRTPAEAEAARKRAEEERARAAAAAASTNRDVRASRVLGSKVVDGEGRGIGEVEDLVIDVAGGRVAYLVLAVGGFLGVGDRLVAYPMPSKDVTRDGDRLALAVDRQAIEAMQGFASDRWPDLNSGQKGKRLRRATELLDTKLADARGKDVGHLRDIVVNLGSATVHYAVAEFDPNWVQAGKVVAVPLRGVRRGDDDDLRMQAELNRLQGAMIFDKDRWPDINDPQYLGYVDRYLKQN